MENRPVSFTSHNNSQKQSGFTLVEVMIVAPIAVLVVGVFIGFIVALTGDALQSTARSQLLEELGSAHEQIRRDARLATEFRATSFPATSPQRPNNSSGTATFTTANTSQNINNAYTLLILRTNATDKDPFDPTRTIVRKEVGGACSSANDPYQVDIVYYAKSNIPDDHDSPSSTWSLWRRVLPDRSSTPCGAPPWQRPSCAIGQDMTTGTCQTEDQLVLKSLQPYALGVWYVNTPDNTSFTSNPQVVDYINPLDVTNPYSEPNGGGVNAKFAYVTFAGKKYVAGAVIGQTYIGYIARQN